jgi:hypothetical protein
MASLRSSTSDSIFNDGDARSFARQIAVRYERHGSDEERVGGCSLIIILHISSSSFFLSCFLPYAMP